MENNKFELASKALSYLKTGAAFLVAADGTGRDNVMTIGWGAMGVMWRSPMMIVPVRMSRYTRELMSMGSEFVVSVPAPGSMKNEIAACGRLSGRDGDKFSRAGVERAESRAVNVPSIAGSAINVECRITGRTVLPMTGMDDAVNDKFYSGESEGDVHELFFGEILECYEV